MARSVGSAFVQVGLDLSTFRKQLGEMPKLAAVAGGRTGADLLKALQEEVRRREAHTKEAIAKGLLSREDAKRIGQQTAHEFNAAVIKELDRLRAAGQQNTAEFIRLQRALKNVGTAGRNAGGDVRKGFLDRLREMPGLVKGVLGGALVASFAAVADRIAATFARVGGAIRDTIALGTDSALVSGSFARLTSSRGIESGATLEALRRGTRGLIADIELQRIANRGLRGELALTAEQYGTLAAAATQLARATGEDVGGAFQRLLETLTRGEATELRTLGIVVDQAAALKAWEEQTGRTASSLTDLERRQIIVTATIEKAGEVLQNIGEDALLPGERLTQFGVAMENIRTATAQAITESPRLVDFFTSIGTKAETSGRAVQDLANRIGAMADTLFEIPAKIAAAGGDLPFPFNLIARANVAITKAPAQLIGAVGGFDEHLRRRQIATERDAARLLAMQEQAFARINELRAEGVALDDKRIVALREEMSLIAQRAQELRRMPPPLGGPVAGTTGAGNSGLSNADIAAARKRLEEEAEKIAKAIQDAFTLENAPEVTAQLAAIPTQLAAAFSTAIDELDQLNVGLDILRENTLAVETAQAALTAARLAGDPAEVAVAESRLADAKARVADRAQQVAAMLQRSSASGEVMRKVADALRGALGKVSVQLEDTGEKLAGFGGHVRTVETLGRAFLSAGDSLGLLGDDARRALTGVLDLARGIEQVAAAKKSIDTAAAAGAGTLAGTLGLLSGVGAVAGGLFAVGSSLLGGPDREERQMEALLEELRENTQALRDSSERLHGLFSTTGPLESAMLEAVRPIFADIEHLPDFFLRPGIALDTLRGKREGTQRLLDESTDPKERAALRDQLFEFDITIAEFEAFMKRMNEAVLRDIELRELAVAGIDASLDIRQLEAQQAAELADATAAGLDRETIARLKNVQALERSAVELARTQAAEDFALDVQERAARLAGDRESAIEAATARAELNAQRELDAAQKLVDAGIITQEMFEALAAVLGEEVAQAAQDAASAFDDMARSFRQDLDVRFLEKVTGDAQGAQVLALQQQQAAELEHANQLLKAGLIDQEDIDRLLAVHAAEMQELVDSFKNALSSDPTLGVALSGDASREARERLAPAEVVHEARAVTAVHATAMLDVDRQILALTREHLPNIDKNIARLLAGEGGGGGAGGGGIGGATTNVNLGGFRFEFHGVGGLDQAAVAGKVRQGTYEGIDQALGTRLVAQRRLAGSAQRR